jgi:hypothetical protein
MIDVFSLFGADSALTDQIYVGATIVTAIVYCSYLAKLKNTGPAASSGSARGGCASVN